MGEEQQTGSSIVLYQGSPLEKIAVSEIVPRGIITEVLHSRFFVPSDIVIGQYGVTGFLIVDTRPEERWESYTDGNLFGVAHSLEHCIHIPEEVRKDHVRISHYIIPIKDSK